MGLPLAVADLLEQGDRVPEDRLGRRRVIGHAVRGAEVGEGDGLALAVSERGSQGGGLGQGANGGGVVAQVAQDDAEPGQGAAWPRRSSRSR